MSTQGVERELRDSARLIVRAGLVPEEEQESVLVAMISTLMPDTDPVILAKAWLHAARSEFVRTASSWEEPTDHDRFRAAMTECQRHDVLVVAGVEALDEVKARAEARSEATGRPLRGLLWFSERAVWHAVDTGVLEVGLRHGIGHPAQEGDALTTSVLGCLERHGVRARGMAGGIQVECHWRRRP